MSNTIRHKNGTSDPSSGDFSGTAELLVNTTDGGLFTKTDGGAVVEIGAGSGGGSLTVGTYGTGAADVGTAVTALRFATGSGFSVTAGPNGATEARVSLNSTFKTWKVPGQTDLVASGEDTINITGSGGITITTSQSGATKTLDIDGGNTNIVLDTTPQLGGDLDMNSKFISSGILGIKNTGTQSELRLFCESSNAHYASIKAPAHSSFSGNITLTLPGTVGNANQVLKSDGSGNLGWTDQTTAYTNSSVDTHLNITSAGSSQVLSWNGSDYAWVDQSAGGSSYADSNVDTHLNISAAGTNQVLSWNGSDYAWVNQSAGGGGGSGTVTSISSGTGLTGGPITGSGTISLANTAVTAGSYTNSSLTIDAQGRVTSASNGAAGLTDNLATRTYSLAIGVGAGSSFTTDGYGIAIGYEAYKTSTASYYSIAIGRYALYSTTSGNYNVAIGDSVLYSNTTGYGQVAVGYSSLRFNTTGGANTGIGNTALYNNQTGNYNTAVGYQSLYSNKTGSNTAVGYRSQRQGEWAFGNCTLGYETLRYNTSGAYHCAVGYQALRNNTSGSYNTGFGTYALYLNTTGYGQSATGYQSLFNNTTGNYNTGYGYQSLYSNSTGSYNTSSGHKGLRNVTTGSGNTGIGFNTSSGIYSPVFDPTTHDNRLVMGHSSVTDAYVQVAWTVTSDARDKMNFAPVPHGLDFVNQLKPTAFQFKYDRETEQPNGGIRYGFKAQDILALEGENPVVIDDEDPSKLKYKGETLVPILVNALQELSATVKELQTELASLKNS
jgi:hypothetical protein